MAIVDPSGFAPADNTLLGLLAASSGSSLVGFSTNGVTQTQSAELTGSTFFDYTWATAGNAHFQTHLNSFNNAGLGAGTKNHASFTGFNVSRHSSTGSATANKPALIVGMEDNYYDNGGDAHYGMEWYVEYYSPNGTSIQMRRPFYCRVQSDDNIADNAIVKFELGADGVGQFIVKSDPTHTLFQVVPSSSAAQVNYIKIASGAAGVGAILGAVGETNAPLLFSSSGSGRIDLMSGFFSQVNLTIAHTASSVNYFQITGGPTTVGPTLSSQGETNVPINIASKGTGAVYLSTNGSTNQVQITHTASAVNTVQLTGGGTGTGVAIGALGETNVPILISSKGSGRIDFLSGSFGQVNFEIAHVASAVNCLIVSGAASGANASIRASAENLLFGSGAPIATTATAGYVMFPSCAGTPTGVPTGQAGGQIPMIYDTTANKVWFYNGSWRGVLVA